LVITKKKAVIYDPEKNMIVDVAPVSVRKQDSESPEEVESSDKPPEPPKEEEKK